MSEAIQDAFEVLARKSRSFALASKLLAPSIRADAAVVYAWCRRVDDAVDLAVDPPSALRALERERAALEQAFGAGPIPDPLLAALREVLQKHRVPERYPRELLEGMEMDVRGATYATVDELLLYCFRVAGTVGLMMAHLMGVSDARALRNASHLGIAMQLTNICRDVAEDWRLGRVYLPEQLVGVRPPGGFFEPARVEDAVRMLLDLARTYYRSADQGLAALQWRNALSIRTARLIYAGIGDEIARGHFDVLRGRAVVPALGKLALMLRAFGHTARELLTRGARFQPVALPAEVRVDDCIRL